MPSKFSLDFQKKFFGAADSLSTGNTELDENLLALRDELNSRFSSNIMKVDPPPGMTRIHLEYLRSVEKAAMAFYGDDVAFIAITDQLTYHICHTTEMLIGQHSMFDLLGVEMSSQKQETLGSALLTLQMQIVSTHELGHIFHGHCQETALFTPRMDSDKDESIHDDAFRAQAMEVDADGYVPHMLLSNLFSGGPGDSLVEKLRPSISKDDLIMTLLTASACGLFYLWGPRRFDPSVIKSYEHPPVLARLNVMLTDQTGWCAKNAPHLADWATLEKFRTIMDVLVEASPELRGVWDEQSIFLDSADGRRYVEQLYNKREDLRIEMAPHRWQIVR
jgi:hypothetical protein